MKIYISHAIRGAKGDAATVEDMRANNDIALQFADIMRMNLAHWKVTGQSYGFTDSRSSNFVIVPTDTELYVPAEHEEFVQFAMDMGVLNVQQVLDVDCEIVKTCDMILCIGPVSPGMQIEIDCAEANGIAVHYLE